MSQEKKALVLAAFAAGSTLAEAAKVAGISSRTISRWAEADPDFAEEVADARDRADDEVEAVTYRNCIDPDPAHNTLRMFWLKSRRRDVYGEKVESVVKQRIIVEYGDDDTAAETPPRPADDPAEPETL